MLPNQRRADPQEPLVPFAAYHRALPDARVQVPHHRHHAIVAGRQLFDELYRELPRGLRSIEQAFSRLKAALRKGAARTVEALWKLIGKLVKTFAPDECANYFRHAGYAC